MPAPSSVDVAVVGAGPAGGMAAIRLAGTGLRVAVLERETLPRKKACGGAMPASARRLFDWDLGDLVEAEIGAQRYLYDHGRRVDLERSHAPILFTSRDRFDSALIERALSLGGGRVHLHEQFDLEHLEEDSGRVQLVSRDGQKLFARYVIGADGATGATARCLGLRPSPTGAALDAAVHVADFAEWSECVIFNIHCVPYGYGWVFPKRDHLSCGIAIWSRPKMLQAKLKEFLDRTFPPGTIRHLEILGHPVPLFAGHRKLASERVCLVGDAASLVDPIVGEGISYALRSGGIAADVIADLLEEGVGSPRVETHEGNRGFHCSVSEASGLQRYEQLIRHGIGRDLNVIRLGARLYFELPEYCYETFIGKAGVY